MKVHFLPPLPPMPQPVPPKPPATPFEIDQATQELIERAKQEQSQRDKRRAMYGKKKSVGRESDDIESKPEDNTVRRPSDQKLNIVI